MIRTSNNPDSDFHLQMDVVQHQKYDLQPYVIMNDRLRCLGGGGGGGLRLFSLFAQEKDEHAMQMR